MPIVPSDSRDIRGKLLFLGTGTSVGVPVIGCGCATCQSPDPRNNRLRCSVLLGLPEGTLLIDTPPDLRTQLLRERITLVHATLFTHSHADHLFGLDDLRLFPYYLHQPMPVFCEESVEQRIRRTFDYAFEESAKHYAGGVPQLDICRIATEPFEVLGATVTPLRLHHGRMDVLGFRVGNVAYCTDTNDIPPESMALLQGLDVLIIDALRLRSHPTHFSLAEAIEVARQVKPGRTLFTHLCHELEHESLLATLPQGMKPAYDGLEIPLG